VTWADDDTLYFADRQMRIAAVSAAGGPARVVVDRPFVLQPHAVPGGRALLYVHASAGAAATTVMLHSLEGGDDVALTEGQSPMYLGDGRLLVLRGNALVAVSLDLAARRVTGDPVVVLEDVASLGGVAQYGVSDRGTLIYIPAAIASESQAALYRVSREGAATEIDGVTREYSDPRLSPDGKRLALHLSDQQNDVWVKDLERGALTRMSFGVLEDETPVWSPDAASLAYSGWCGATDDARCVFRRRLDGRGEPDVLWKTDAHTHLTDWSPDGRTIVMEVVHPERRSDLLLLDVERGAATEFLATTFNEQAARISPDGRWIAYQSNESGEMEVYLQSFPDGGRQVQVSSGGGVQPVWSRDGGELYYRSATHLMAARVSTGGLPGVGQPARLFRDTYLRPQGDNHAGYDVFPDGTFVFIDVLKGADALTPSFIAVFNWFEELKSTGRN
jgi:serine/threonine-protein kinase